MSRATIISNSNTPFFPVQYTDHIILLEFTTPVEVEVEVKLNTRT